MQLRDYQRAALDELYAWMRENDGHPCLVLPTGAGKSVVIAELCREAVTGWPETKILMLTHVKELIEQNAAKMLAMWPNAPLGIYSAGLRRKELGEPITFGGIQSLRGRADEIGHIDIVIIDEAHTVSHKDAGGYRDLLAELARINPHLRVIGLTATPWRLGHGLITDKPAIFDGLLEPVSIEELIHRGFLAPLRSKITGERFDLSKVTKRGGEYVEGELSEAIDTADQNERVADEIIARAGDRKAWLFFCCGVQHAEHMRDVLMRRGILAACVTGDTPPGERAKILNAFKSGQIRAVTNANVLCLSQDTEILTASGWVGMSEMTMHHRIAAWKECGDIEWTHPDLVVRRDAYQGEKMIEATGNAAPFSVTGNHRMVVRSGRGGKSIRVTAAETLTGRPFSIPAFGSCESVPVANVPQPPQDTRQQHNARAYVYRSSGLSSERAQHESIEFSERKTRICRQLDASELGISDCAFIGFWLGDGSRSGKRISIAQSERYSDNIEWLRNVARGSKLHFTEHRRSRRGNMTAGAIIFAFPWGTGSKEQFVDTRIKSLDYWLNKSGVNQLMALSRDQLEAMLDGFWRADGNHHTKGQSYRYISGTQYALYSWLQCACVSRGISASITKLGAPRKLNHTQQWRFSWGGREAWSYVRGSTSERIADPGEKVWCVTSSTSYLICRRNGKAFVTGNTTGFDYPNIDLIAMLRPTLSPSLYVQMAGRGLRLKSHTDHCLVLDFAGNVETHGPITCVRDPKKANDKKGDAPAKTCDNCGEIVALSARECPACGEPFPEAPKPAPKLRDDDIMGRDPEKSRDVLDWRVSKHVSKANQKEMVRIDYALDSSTDRVSEFLCLRHGGYAQVKSENLLRQLSQATGVEIDPGLPLDEIANLLDSAGAPTEISYEKQGEFFRVKSRKFAPPKPREAVEEDDDPIPF